MKPFVAIVTLVGFFCGSVLARPAVQGRRLEDIKVISPKVLQRSISPKFYQSLLISPIEGWIVVRASIVNGRISGARVMRSELNGAYDQLALKFADDLKIAGYFNMENPSCGGSVLLHLLVYQIADGAMVLSFPTLDDAGGNQMRYWGCARLGVVKSDGRWVEIEGPEGLHGKGWAVRPPGFGVPGENQNTPPPREKKYRPGPPRPPVSVLEPILASTKR